MSTDCINLAILMSLVECEHPDLGSPVVTPRLIAAAADTLAQELLSLGFRLADHFSDGGSVTQSFHSRTTGGRLDDVTTTLLMMPDDHGCQTLRLAVRSNWATAVDVDACSRVFAGSVRINGVWFSAVQTGVSTADLVSELQRTHAIRREEIRLGAPMVHASMFLPARNLSQQAAL